MHMAYAYAICIWHMHMAYAYGICSISGSLRGGAPQELQEGGVCGGRAKPSPPRSAGGAGWWPKKALGPVEYMPKAGKGSGRSCKIGSKNVKKWLNRVLVGRFGARVCENGAYGFWEAYGTPPGAQNGHKKIKNSEKYKKSEI